MAEIMLQSKVVNQEWRDCLLNNKVDIFEFIKKMIKMAANDRPSEFIVKRSNLLDTLYSCEVAASSKLEKQDAPTSTPRPSLKIRIKLKKPNLLAKAPATPPPPQQKLQNRVLQKISIQSLNNIPKPTSQKVEFQPRDSDMEKKLDLSKRKLQMRYNEVECMKQKRKDDDSYILPVLLRFDGQPQVDEEGNILYRFPSLQRTAAQTSGRKEYVGRRFS